MSDEPVKIKKIPTRYDYELLMKYVNENNVTLLDDYSDVNLFSETHIKGKCLTDGCDHIVNKIFKQIINVSGFFCYDCSRKKGAVNRRITEIANYSPTSEKRQPYSVERLTKLCDENNVILLETYDDATITSRTIVKGKCITIGCDSVWEREFQMMCNYNSPFFCPTCTKANVRTQTKQTFLLNYGTENPHGLPIINDKRKNTCMERYGTKHPMSNRQVREKYEQTNLERHGDIYPLRTEKMKEKSSATNLINYGVPFAIQNPTFAEKIFKSSMRCKTYTSPNGINFTCQGYEPFALTDLIVKMGISEQFIVTERDKVPNIQYNDEDGKTRRHYVDIYIESLNLCIEIKSTWTIKLEPDKIFTKQRAAKAMNLKYEIWVYNEKGVRETVYE